MKSSLEFLKTSQGFPETSLDLRMVRVYGVAVAP
jgi:hypothetical protein